jgi:hypothetical protein
MISKNIEQVVLAYEKGYRVINGEVISPFTGKPRKLRIQNTKGYKKYSFTINEKGKSSYPVEVHKLVAYQKYGNKMFDPELEVRHLNNNSLNNVEENILLGTKVDNANDKPEEQRRKLSINASTSIRKFTDIEMDNIRRYHRGSYRDTMEMFDITSKGTLHYILNTEYQTIV